MDYTAFSGLARAASMSANLNPVRAKPKAEPGFYQTVYTRETDQGTELVIRVDALNEAASRYLASEREDFLPEGDTEAYTVEGVRIAIMKALAVYIDQILLGNPCDMDIRAYQIYRAALHQEAEKEANRV